MCSIQLGVDVAIDALPRDGEANSGIVEYLAEVLGVKLQQYTAEVG